MEAADDDVPALLSDKYTGKSDFSYELLTCAEDDEMFQTVMQQTGTSGVVVLDVSQVVVSFLLSASAPPDNAIPRKNYS